MLACGIVLSAVKSHHAVLRTLRALLRRVAPNWHPLRTEPIRRLVMRYVEWRRPEILPVKHGFNLQIPREHRSPLALSLWLDGEYEPAESQLIVELLAPGDLAFDIGANVGYMTCLMAQAVAGAEGAQVHAFEPEPANFDILQHNLSLNRLKGVEAQHLALSSKTGKEWIYLSNQNFGDHTLVPLPGREKILIESVTFDDYYASHCAGRRVRFVKIDVQGYELEVLKGMRQSLARGLIDIVLLEFWPARLKKAGSSSAELLTLLASMPYRRRILSDNGGGVYKSLGEMEAVCDSLERNDHLFFNIVLNRHKP